jgi:electron transfer flavoprotein alpha subunit
MSILVIAEHDNATLAAATLNTLTAAAELGPVTLLVAGSNCRAAAEAASRLVGAERVLMADAEHYGTPLAEDLASLVLSLASDYSHLLAPATTFGKNLMPRIAALLDVAQISEIIGIEDEQTFVRPIYAGNVLATVRSEDPIKVLTVRSTAFEPAAQEGGAEVIEEISSLEPTDLLEFVGQEITRSDRPELSSARVVVSGGRGMQNGENFGLLEAVADQLGGAVGASRAAVDAGYVPNDYQVGQTGKVVAPDLYVAVGISGAIQHLAGMKDSKCIVAINKDADAPIFQIADYGLVADLFEAVPELTSELEVQGVSSGG